MPGSLYPQHQADFLATIQIVELSKTRRTKYPRNGIRLAFAYPEDFEERNFTISDVWPDFLDAHGNSMSDSIDLIGSYKAEMHILFPEMIEKHYERLTLNPNFICVEGQDIVARGRMTKFLNIPS